MTVFCQEELRAVKGVHHSWTLLALSSLAMHVRGRFEAAADACIEVGVCVWMHASRWAHVVFFHYACKLTGQRTHV